MSIDEVMGSVIEYGILSRRATVIELRSFRTSIKAAIEQHVTEVVAGERVTVLDEVLRGLRSERDTDQLRAIIAEVEAIRAAAELGRQMEETT